MDNGTSATDIITYIGVPLAVLGVLPIIYTSVRAILTQRSIRSILKRHQLLDSALTRVSLIGGIVEVELPRCTITPLDRELDDGYWKMNVSHVPLKGGSWSIFHWNRLITGRVLYRCQYKDELQIPQADIGFEELVAYLLDRGAVPDAQGWKLLKTVGLWTPPGTALLRPPSSMAGSVLTIAPTEDSDGVLSLQVQWKSEWEIRSQESLPPFWMRLEQPQLLIPEDEKNSNVSAMNVDETPTVEDKTETSGDLTEKPSLLACIQETKTLLKAENSTSIRFRTEGEHVHSVYFENLGIVTGKTRDLSRHGETFEHWFVCVASALGEYENPGLYNFSIPTNVTAFVRRRSVPCGVMVVLGLLSGEDVPPWDSPAPPLHEPTSEIHQRLEEERLAREMENIMPPHQAAEARRIRSQQEASRFHYGHLKRRKEQLEYEERRLIEAIQSPRLDNKIIAEASLAHLVGEKIVPDDYSVERLARAVLYLIMLDESQGRIVADILERWMLWSQYGGMQKIHLELLMENKILFCYASALVAVVQRANAAETNLGSDMNESMRLWKRVRLG